MASKVNKTEGSKASICKPLPKEIRSIVRSGIAITNVAQCVEELVLNAIDAKATSIFVGVNLDQFNVRVEDDGIGISRQDLESVGTRYTTSKCVSIEDLNTLRYYGYRGEALASIIDVSSSVDLISRSGDGYPYKRQFSKGKLKGGTSKQADSVKRSNGLTVLVCGLLSKLPVRQNRVDKSLQIEEIKCTLQQIALINPLVTIQFRNEANSTLVLNYRPSVSQADAFKQLFGEKNGLVINLVEEYHLYDKILFNAFIGKDLYRTKAYQFVYVNKRYIGSRGKIHRQLNEALLKVLNNEKGTKGEEEGKQTSGGGDKKYPIFIVNIKCPFDMYDISLEPKKSQVEFRDWESCLKGLETLVLRFKSTLQTSHKAQQIIKKSVPIIKDRRKRQGGRGDNSGHSQDLDVEGIGQAVTTHDVKRAVHSRFAVRERAPEEMEDEISSAVSSGLKSMSPVINSPISSGLESPSANSFSYTNNKQSSLEVKAKNKTLKRPSPHYQLVDRNSGRNLRNATRKTTTYQLRKNNRKSSEIIVVPGLKKKVSVVPKRPRVSVNADVFKKFPQWTTRRGDEDKSVGNASSIKSSDEIPLKRAKRSFPNESFLRKKIEKFPPEGVKHELEGMDEKDFESYEWKIKRYLDQCRKHSGGDKGESQESDRIIGGVQETMEDLVILSQMSQGLSQSQARGLSQGQARASQGESGRKVQKEKVVVETVEEKKKVVRNPFDTDDEDEEMEKEESGGDECNSSNDWFLNICVEESKKFMKEYNLPDRVDEIRNSYRSELEETEDGIELLRKIYTKAEATNSQPEVVFVEEKFPTVGNGASGNGILKPATFGTSFGARQEQPSFRELCNPSFSSLSVGTLNGPRFAVPGGQQPLAQIRRPEVLNFNPPKPPPIQMQRPPLPTPDPYGLNKLIKPKATEVLERVESQADSYFSTSTNQSNGSSRSNYFCTQEEEGWRRSTASSMQNLNQRERSEMEFENQSQGQSERRSTMPSFFGSYGRPLLKTYGPAGSSASRSNSFIGGQSRQQEFQGQGQTFQESRPNLLNHPYGYQNPSNQNRSTYFPDAVGQSEMSSGEGNRFNRERNGESESSYFKNPSMEQYREPPELGRNSKDMESSKKDEGEGGETSPLYLANKNKVKGEDKRSEVEVTECEPERPSFSSPGTPLIEALMNPPVEHKSPYFVVSPVVGEIEEIEEMMMEMTQKSNVDIEELVVTAPPSPSPVVKCRRSESNSEPLPPPCDILPSQCLRRSGDGEWSDNLIFRAQTQGAEEMDVGIEGGEGQQMEMEVEGEGDESSWGEWEVDILLDAKGQDWMQITEEENGGRLIYINLSTGDLSYDMVNIVTRSKVSASQAARRNKNFRPNWLRRYFPKGCNKFWRRDDEEEKIGLNGNPSAVTSHLGKVVKECIINGNVHHVLQESEWKWRDGKQEIVDGVEGVGLCSSEYWNQCCGGVGEQPVLNLNAREVKFWNKSMSSSYRFSKEDLARVKVLMQWDRKFIVAKMQTRMSNSENESNVLVLFDQHAVHERIRLEQFIKDAYVWDCASGEKRLESMKISPPMGLTFSDTEVRVMGSYKDVFIGIGVEILPVSSTSVKVASVPKALADKVHSEAVGNRENLMRSLISSLVQEQVNQIIDTKGVINHSMPKMVFNILCSQACHGAIKFGDELELRVCEEMISNLKECKTPFQCAHGRPALVPLIDLSSLSSVNKDKLPLLHDWRKYSKTSEKGSELMENLFESDGKYNGEENKNSSSYFAVEVNYSSGYFSQEQG